MSSKPTKQPKPEDMLLRVIRVAEILVKSQNKVSEETPVQSPNNQTVTTVIQSQKTQ